MIVINYQNKDYSITEFMKIAKIDNYENFRKWIYRNNHKSKYQDYEITIKKQLTLRTLINQHFKNQTMKEQFFNKNCVLTQWNMLIKKNPENYEYQKFHENLIKYISFCEQKKIPFKYSFFCRRYLNKKDIEMCDTETTFHKEWKNDNFILKKTDTDDKIKKNLDIKKIKTWYENNPKEKPFMWAWTSLNFKTGEYKLYNYYQAVNHLNTLTKSVIHFYHNLSYDGPYLASALIEEFNYQIFYLEEDKKKISTKKNNLHFCQRP